MSAAHPSRPPSTVAGVGLATELLAAAERSLARQPGGDRWLNSAAELPHLTVELDEEVCRALADRYDDAPVDALDDDLIERYQSLKHDSLLLYHELVSVGVHVEAWSSPGQPYRNSGELVDRVRETRNLLVYLTVNGHGPLPPSSTHPLCQRCGVSVGGIELWYNDLLRVTHDVFGHVMLSTGFGPIGELKAGYCQLALSSAAARPVLFTEQIAQTCWFYFGAHLRDKCGRLPVTGEREYLRPRARPYPEQKIFATGPEDLTAFQRMFRIKEI
jgi:hypothetical protein